MKKLLLTLLGAAALCGLSPHPASAQETTFDAPLTKTIRFSQPDGDKIFYKSQTNNTWEEKGAAAFTLKKTNAKDTEFVKIGDVIFEISKEATCGTNVIDIPKTNSNRGIGLYIGTKFRVYPDPEIHKMDDGSGAKAYKITLNCKGKNNSNTYSIAYYSSNNIITCLNASTTTYDIKITARSTETGNLPTGPLTVPKLCLTAESENGMSSDIDNWIVLAKPSAATNIFYITASGNSSNDTDTYTGNSPLAYISGGELEISTDTPNPPKSPAITTDLAEDKYTDGKWHSLSPITITMAPQSDDYDADNHTIKYVESKTPLDVEAIDWAAENVKTYDAPFKSNASMYYYARVESAYKDETFTSEISEIATEILNPTIISDLAELHKSENDGKVVMLDMPLMVRAHTLVYPQDATNKYTNAVYVRDVNGASVKLISRRNKKEDPYFPYSNSTFSPLTYAFNGVNPTLSLMKPGMVIGMYHYNGGKNPEIVVRDLTSDPAVDYYPLLGTEAPVSYENAKEEYNKFGFTDEQTNGFIGFLDVDDVTPDMFGKTVIVRGLTDWNKDDNSFRLSKAQGEKRISIRYGDKTKGALGAVNLSGIKWETPEATDIAELQTAETYSMVAIVEYDPETEEYYLAPKKGEIYAPYPAPAISIKETEKEEYEEITDTDRSKVWQYTHACTDGTITLSFDVTKPSTSASLPSFTFVIENENGENIYTGASSKALTTCSIETTKLNFNEETGSATVYAYAYSANVQRNRTNDGRRLKIVIRDAVQTGPRVESVAVFRDKLAAKDDEFNINKELYVRFAGRFAVVARNGNVLQLRDVDKDLPLNPADATDTVSVFKPSYILVSEDNGWEQSYSQADNGTVTKSGFNVTSRMYGGIGSQSYGREITIGDEIRQFIGKVTVDPAGNYVVDLTGLENFFYASALDSPDDNSVLHYGDNTSVPGFERGTPRFFPYMSLEDQSGALVMREENCVNRPVAVALSDFEEHPESHPETIELTDALLDAEMKVMKVQVEKAADADDYTARFTADGVALLWDMFGTDQTPSEPSTAALADEPEDTTGDDTPAEPAKSVKQQLADHMAAGTEHFNVTGILRKHTDGKYALQVEKIEPTPVDKAARFFAGGEEIDGDTYEFVKRVDLTTDTPEGAVIKMTVGDGQQQAYDAKALKAIDADTKVTIERWVPGLLKGQPASITLTKLSTDVSTLAQMAEGTNAKNFYHFRKHLKVIAADGEGTAMAADAAGRIALIAGAPAAIEAGKYITDVVLDRKGDYTAAVHADETVAPLDEEDEYAIATPEAVTVSAIDPAAHTGKAVTLFGAAIKEGKAVENEGQGASYAIDPTFKAIPADEAEGWKLTGYLLPGADSKPVIYLTAAEAVGRVALPVITPAEAAFLDKTTVTVTCATTGAAIEYSTDGGKTWTAYSEPFEVETTGDILARATAAGMLPSRQAKASVVREYLSGDVTITIDEQNGKTVITITGPGKIYYSIDGGAEKQYDGAITIANDTQTELSGTISAYALEEGKRPGAAKEASYKVSGISGIGADGSEADGVKVEGNTITVPEGAQTFDIAGRRVNPQGLPRGIYIVRLASGKALKVVIK